MIIPYRLSQIPAMLKQRPAGIVVRPETTGTSCQHRRFIRDLLGNRNEANAIVEFVLVFPIIIALVMGIWQFGVIYSNMIALTQAATAGAQVLQSDRLSPNGDPCSDTYNAIVNAAPSLVASKITLTISMNNNTAITGNSCSGKQTQLAMGGPVTVKVTYPYNVTIYGISATSGSLSSGTVSEIEY
jgi:Flp pilus assembly protein TadG